MKVAGEGMPRRSFPSEFGDLYVEFTVRAMPVFTAVLVYGCENKIEIKYILSI
jgi:hypothetical protein